MAGEQCFKGVCLRAAISPILDRPVGAQVTSLLHNYLLHATYNRSGALHFFPLVQHKAKNMHVCMCVHYSDAAPSRIMSG
jgi:hypothetical protein